MNHHLDNMKMRPQTKPQQTSAPAHTITLGDAILRNPVNTGKAIATTIMLDTNFWLLVDIAGLPVWATA
jgi:hypothetical protein